MCAEGAESRLGKRCHRCVRDTKPCQRQPQVARSFCHYGLVLDEDAGVPNAYREARREAMRQATDRLQEAARKAVDALREVQRSGQSNRLA